MIVSNDTIIMKPPYQINNKIINLIASISEKIGTVNAFHLNKPSPELRKKNQIKSIQSSLEIEGNLLNEQQVTAILEGKRVLAAEKDILEVKNAIEVYKQINSFNYLKINSLLKAHKLLMKGLIENAGSFRTKNIGIVKGSKVEHLAPNGKLVTGLINTLFDYLKIEDELTLIKSCVFHYEFEFIHPFSDGNGRMGRLWQNLILMSEYPVFEFLPIESMIKRNQENYYSSLAKSDKNGHSTPFIEFMLQMINQSLEELLQLKKDPLTVENRIQIFKEKRGNQTFKRKDYLDNFKTISQATASRDLKWAVDKKLLIKTGDKRNSRYQFQ